jgi:hypothetical protein
MRRPVARYSKMREHAPPPVKTQQIGIFPSVHDATPTTMRQQTVATKDPLDRTDMSRWTRNFDLMASISRIRGGPGRVVPKDTHGRYLSQQKQRIRQH